MNKSSIVYWQIMRSLGSAAPQTLLCGVVAPCYSVANKMTQLHAKTSEPI